MKIKKKKLRKMIEEAHRAAQEPYPGEVDYDEAEDYADKIIAGLKKQKQPDEWPKFGERYGERYWSLSSIGCCMSRWGGCITDTERKKRGIYRTEAEAKYRDGVRLLNEYLRSTNNGYEFVLGKENNYMEWNANSLEIDLDSTREFYNPNIVYFASVDDRQKAIDNMPENLKKFMKPM
jgi:hypothetical protein